MSQLEETLGGLRIIKAFIAEDKMVDRFKQCSDELRDATNKVAIRQSLAHPMSEFLGTLLIVLVLWFGAYSGRRHFHGSINVHLLYGDSVQYHQSVERLCKGRIQHSKGSGIHGTCGQNTESRESH